MSKEKPQNGNEKRINKTKGVTAVKTEVSEFPEAPHVDDSK